MITEHTHQKYKNDAVYHAMVNWMVAFLVDGQFNAGELEQATELAQQLSQVQRRLYGEP